MRRVSVDIGGTFTDTFVVWDGASVSGKALTTHHNLALGFNESLANGCRELGQPVATVLGGVDSVRYATTLGTNALIERKGPRIGALVTAGFKSTIPLSRGRGYGEGLDQSQQQDIPNADRPDAIVPIEMIREVRERVDYLGDAFLTLDEDDLRRQIASLVDAGAEALIVVFTNSVVNPAHELRAREIFLEDYPGHLLGAVPFLLSHQVAGRKGEYARAQSTIMDAFLHAQMYHGLGTLELNLRGLGYDKPMLVNHNSGGMAQLNSTDALQTVHSGPVSGIAASEHLSGQTGLGNVVATDMGGTSFDIGLVVGGGVKYYDFNPVIGRWLVSIPMVHLKTLGAGGGSIASYDRMFRTVRIGPESAGSDPGARRATTAAACTRRSATPTSISAISTPPTMPAARSRSIHAAHAVPSRTVSVNPLGLDSVAIAKLIKSTADANMATGIATELRTRGYDPADFTVLAYGGNGPLHACGLAAALGVDKVLCPPFASVFSAVGAGNMNQLHIHEKSTYTVLFDANTKAIFGDFDAFNAVVAELEERGRDDLLRQGMAAADIRFRLELDMRYGNQRVQTAVVTEVSRLTSRLDVLKLIDQFFTRYGERFGAGSQSPEAGVRINTMRVAAYVEQPTVGFEDLSPGRHAARAATPTGDRPCHFIGHDAPLATAVYGEDALAPGTHIAGPAIVTTRATTYLVEPGWRFEAAAQGAAWFIRAARA